MILLTIYCLSSCLEEQLPEFAGSTLHNHLWSLLLPSFSPDNEPLNPDILPLTVFWIGVFAFITAGTMKWFLWIYTVPGIEAWCSLRWSCFQVQLHFFWFFLRFMKYSEVSVMNLGLNYFLFFNPPLHSSLSLIIEIASTSPNLYFFIYKKEVIVSSL